MNPEEKELFNKALNQLTNISRELAMFQMNELARNAVIQKEIDALKIEDRALRNLINDNWGESRKKFAEFDHFTLSQENAKSQPTFNKKFNYKDLWPW